MPFSVDFGFINRQRSLLVPCILLILFVLAPVQLFASQANVFIYHRFGESRYPSTNIDVDQFAEQLAYLKKTNRLVMSMEEVAKHLVAHRDFPPGTVALTVDDAFESFYDKAFPLLKKYRFPVTLFVNTDSVGSSGYLSWEQLRQLAREGVVIGNHTATHDYLLERHQGESASAWRVRIMKDIEKAQNKFADELGLRPDLFAYPYGEYSPELVEIIKELGFAAAVAQQSGVVSPETDPFTIPRFPMGGPFASMESFRDKVAMQPLSLVVLEPDSPVLSSDAPPLLKVRIAPDRYDLHRLQGFVQGENRLDIRAGSGVGEFSVRAVKPLSGRRNKYTLTVPLLDGSGWAWFSYPWFRPKSGL